MGNDKQQRPGQEQAATERDPAMSQTGLQHKGHKYRQTNEHGEDVAALPHPTDDPGLPPVKHRRNQHAEDEACPQCHSPLTPGAHGPQQHHRGDEGDGEHDDPPHGHDCVHPAEGSDNLLDVGVRGVERPLKDTTEDELWGSVRAASPLQPVGDQDPGGGRYRP